MDNLNRQQSSSKILQKSVSNASNFSQPRYSNSNLKIVRSDVGPTGEAVQLVRPLATEAQRTTEEIVGELVNKYDYKKSEVVKASEDDLTAMEQAFGSTLADRLLKTYDGSAIIADNQQDLIGEKYLAEQIRRMQEKKVSVIDRYSHLLYEGEQNYQSNVTNPLMYSSSSNLNLRPIQSQQQQQQHHFALPKTPSQNVLIEQSQPSKTNSQFFQEQTVNNQKQYQDKIQQERAQLERFQQERAQQERLQQERAQQERDQQERIQQERNQQERAQQERNQQQQERLYQENLKQQQFKASQASQRVSSTNLQKNQSARNLKTTTTTSEAYNDPQFKSILEHVTKPLNVPVEMVQMGAQWPDQDKLAYLAEPIIIPAPEPLVISAPNVVKIGQNSTNVRDAMKQQVNYYPKVAGDQKFFNDFGINQINLGSNNGK